MATTFELISAVTVGAGGSASMQFSSIPSTYTDLNLYISARTNNAGIADNMKIQFNSTTTNYKDNYLFSTGTGTGAGASTTNTSSLFNYADGATATANTFSNVWFYIPNYAASINKTFIVDTATENNTTGSVVTMQTAGLWANTAAINNITISPLDGTAFVQYTTAYLYGVKNA